MAKPAGGRSLKWEERLGWRPKWLNGFIFTVGEGCICSSTIVIAWCFHILLKLRSVLCLYLVSLNGWCNKRYYRSLFDRDHCFGSLDYLNLVHEKPWHLSEVTKLSGVCLCSIIWLAVCLYKFYWNMWSGIYILWLLSTREELETYDRDEVAYQGLWDIY